MASLAKKLALPRISELQEPDVIFLQEIMCEGEGTVNDLLKLLGGWNFEFVDTKGKSGGLIIGWSQLLSS